MIVRACKTPKIIVGSDLYKTLDACLPNLVEGSIVVVTSKIVSICQGRVVQSNDPTTKIDLAQKESEYFIKNEQLSRWGMMLTINSGILIANAGIDESNGNGYLVLWPKDIQKTINDIWEYLRKKYHLKHLGVIITDSRLVPLRWGTLGVGIAWCGFSALNDYIGTPDIFGKNLHATKASVLDGLAAAAVLVMGEGAEQTPLAVVSEVPFVGFQSRPPSNEELVLMQIDKKDDIYAPLTDTPLWKKGGAR